MEFFGVRISPQGHPGGNLARENVCLRERIAGLRKAYSLLLRSFALQAGAVGPGQSGEAAARHSKA
jgi:hypothetical protein